MVNLVSIPCVRYVCIEIFSNFVLFQAAVNWPASKHICGDLHEKATPRTRANVLALNKARIAEGK